MRNSPWIILLIGLFIATILERLVAVPLIVALRDQALLGWLVTIALIGVALWAGRQYYTQVFRRPNLGLVVMVTFLILLAFRLLAYQIALLPAALGVALSAVVAIAGAYLIWQYGRATAYRNWLAPLFGLMLFFNLYWGARGLDP